MNWSVALDAIDALIADTVEQGNAINAMTGEPRRSADTGIGLRIGALNDARSAIVTAAIKYYETGGD